MADHTELAQKYLRTNFMVLLLDGICAVGGFSTLGLASILPGMIHEIARRNPALQPWENRIATILLVCFWGLSSITSFMFGGWFENRSHRKPPFLILAFVGRLAFPAMFLITLFMERFSPVVFLVLFASAMSWWSLSNGIMVPQWFDFIGRLIPVNRRGILLGGRDGIGTLLGVAMIGLFPWLSGHFIFPVNYALLYGAGALFLVLSGVPWLFVKEIPYEPHELRPARSLGRQMSETLEILRSDPVYRRLLVAMAVIGFWALAPVSLVTLKAIRGMGLSEARSTAFASLAGIVNIACYAVAVPLFGLLADRIGYKRIAYGSYSLLAATFILALLAATPAAYLTAIGLMGVVQGGSIMVQINFPLEFVPENRRPSYMALRSLANLPFFFMPVVGGWIADKAGYVPVFVLAIVALGTGLTILGLTVRDPRKENVGQPRPGCSRRLASKPCRLNTMSNLSP